MSFKGITFAGQNVAPKCDGGLYQGICNDGILWGCSMSVLDNSLTIQSGLFIAGGRVCQVDGATTINTGSGLLANGYRRIIMTYDMSQPIGYQWTESFDESASVSGFGALTQDAINGTGVLYQVELAIVQVSGGYLTSVYREMPKMSVGRLASTSTTTSQTAQANTEVTLLTINKPADKTFGIATGRCGFNVSSAGVNVRMSLADNDTDHYINGTDSRSLGISGIATGNVSLKILVRSTTTTASVASAFLDVVWF